MPFEKLVSFTKDVSDLADQPALGSAAALKAHFDAAPDEVRQYLNRLIDSLQKYTAGDSGAKNIGASTISGLVGNDVQSLLEQITIKYAKKEQPFINLATLQNGWKHTDFNGLVYRINEFGHVELDGEVYGGTTAGNTTIAQIPLEILPSGREMKFKVVGINLDGSLADTAIWVHANTREIKFYGAGAYRVVFDGVTLRKGV